MSFLSIDLGATHFSVVLCIDGRCEFIRDPFSGSPTIDPYVTYGPDGWLVGAQALAKHHTGSTDLVFNIKQLLALPSSELSSRAAYWPFHLIKTRDQASIKLGHHVIQADKFVQIVIHTFVRWAQDQFPTASAIREVILNLPHHFTSAQQDLFIKCARDIGMETIHFVDDQTAVALMYKHQKRPTEPIKVMFFNQGASSFHASVFQFNKENMTELGTVDDGHTGGDEYDQRILTHSMNQLARVGIQVQDWPTRCSILRACKQAKHELTDKLETVIQLPQELGVKETGQVLSRETFDRLNADLFAFLRIMLDSVLMTSSVRRSAIEEVVLVGNATKIPRIRQLVKEYFGPRVRVVDELRIAHVFALGGCLKVARMKQLDPIYLPEIHADSLPTVNGVKNQSPGELQMSEPIGFQVDGSTPVLVIPSSTTILPLYKERIFTTEFDYQQPSIISIWSGIPGAVDVGVLRCPEIPPTRKGTPVFRITFSINDIGDLTVTVCDLCTASEVRLTLPHFVSSKPDPYRFSQRKLQMGREISSISRALNSPTAQARLSEKRRNQCLRMCDSIRSWLVSGEDVNIELFGQRRQELFDCWFDCIPYLYPSTIP